MLWALPDGSATIRLTRRSAEGTTRLRSAKALRISLESRPEVSDVEDGRGGIARTPSSRLDWIESGPRNTATYTNLPSGSYVLRVQGANSAGIWNREGLTLDIHVAPPPGFSWWAMCIYALFALFLAWCGLRIYRSYVLDRYSKAIEMEMIEADNRADDHLQEQVELQDEIVQSAYEHSVATLSLVRDSILLHADREVVRGDLADSSLKRLKALTHLEECHYFQDGESAIDLRKFADIVISELLQETPVNPETIITINEITSRLVPDKIASPAAIVLYELIENCFLHAFDEASPANYIHLRLEGVEDRQTFTFGVQLSVGDNGVGLPVNPGELVLGSSGIGIAHAIVSKLGGTMEFTGGNGTLITVNFPATDPI
jgi:two-component sensor histidine kinase